MRDNNSDNQLKLIYQNIVGLKMILAEMARKYNDPKLEQRKKASYLKMAKDCNKIIEDANDFLRQHNYHGS